MSLTDPLVTTDQPDYAPGSTATITASGFGIGDDILFQVSVIDPTSGATLWSGASWDAYADGSGSLLTNLFVSGAYANTTIQLTATDLATGAVATTVFTDNPPVVGLATLNEDAAAASGSANSITLSDAGGLIVNALNTGPTGTGVVQSFVMIQQHGHATTEEGFNTDWSTGQAPLDDKNTHVFNHSITLNQVPLVNADGTPWDHVGTAYRAFNLDVNQDQHHPLISLDQLKIYVAGTNDLSTQFTGTDGSFSFGSNAGLVYDLGGHWISIDAGAGSGHGDIAFLIPDGLFTTAISSNSLSSNPYVFLYSHFGDQTNETAVSGGFEEWWLNSPPPSPSHYQWSLFKDVTVSAPHDQAAGTDPDTGLVLESNGLVGTHNDNLVDHAGQVLTYTVHLENDGGVGGAAIPDIQVWDSLLNLYLPEVGGFGTYHLDHGDGSHAGDWVSGASLTAVTVTLAGDAINAGNPNGTTLEVGATWTWTYTHTVTQGEIDSNGTNDALNTGHGFFGTSDDADGGVQGYIDNTVTAAVVGTSDADIAAQNGLGSSNPTSQITQSPVEFEPDWAITKAVSVSPASDAGSTDTDTLLAWLGKTVSVLPDASTSSVVDSDTQKVTYTIKLANDGNVTIGSSDIVVTDSLLSYLFGGAGALPHLANWTYGDITGTLTTNDGGLNPFASLDADPTVAGGETWTWTFTLTAADLDTLLGAFGNGDFGYTDPTTGAFVHLAQDGTVTTDPTQFIHHYIDNTVTASTTDHIVATSYDSTAVAVELEPAVRVEKLVSADGAHWFFTNDTDHGTSDQAYLLNLTESGGHHLFTTDPAHPGTVGLLSSGTLNVVQGAALYYDAVITNTSQISETVAQVSDSTGLTFTFPTNPLAAGASEVATATLAHAVSGDSTNTLTVSGTGTVDGWGDAESATDADSATYTGHAPGVPGLTAGFWSQHTLDWNGVITLPSGNPDDPKAQNLVNSHVLSSTDVLGSLPTHGIVDLSTPGHPASGLGVLLGDANGNGSVDGGEVTLAVPLSLAVSLVSASMSTKSDARLNLLQQAVAAQLNVDNHDRDPGGQTPGSDLMGDAVKWLLGTLPFNNGHSVPSVYDVDSNGNHVFDSGDFSSLAKLTLTNFVSTSSTDWTPAPNGDGYFRVDTGNTLFDGTAHTVSITGQGLKNALEDFNQAHLLTTADGALVYWAGDPAHAQTNDVHGLWKVLYDHDASGVGIALS